MKNNKIVSILMACCLIQVAPLVASEASKGSTKSYWQSFTSFFKPDQSLDRYKSPQYCDLSLVSSTVKTIDANGRLWLGYDESALKSGKKIQTIMRNITALGAIGCGCGAIFAATKQSRPYEQSIAADLCGPVALGLCVGSSLLHSQVKKIDFCLNKNKTKQQENVPAEVTSSKEVVLWQETDKWKNYKLRNYGIVSVAFLTAAGAKLASSHRR